MHQPDEKYVYHGSRELFEHVVPKRQVRTQLQEDGSQKIIFDDTSFHATPYRWIALAYIYNQTGYEIDGKMAHYNIGVSLYNYREELDIFGFSSLEESLQKMYGDGGYIFAFEKEKFFHTDGLGTFEVITRNDVVPAKIERIDDPVKLLRELGIKFKFIDLALSENKKHRNYY